MIQKYFHRRQHSLFTDGMDLCLYFGVSFTNIWNDEVNNEELGVMFFTLSMMLNELPNGKTDADATMMLAQKCGLEEAAEYCKTHKVSGNPYKSKTFAKDK